jgi:hypothetical protein
MLRIPHCLHNRLTDGGKVVSPTHLPRSTPQKHFFSASDTHFCQRLTKSQGTVRLEGLGKLKKFVHLIRSRTHGLPAYSIVPQPTTPLNTQYVIETQTCFCLTKPSSASTPYSNLYVWKLNSPWVWGFLTLGPILQQHIITYVSC